jgi:Mg-chelatase subunit ChlD
MKLISLVMALLVVLSAAPISAAETSTECVLTEEQECVPYRPRVDVVFVIDSTGSMADEIRTVKTHLTKIVKEVEAGQPSPYLRVGVVSYRDHKPEEYGYLYKKLELTDDIEKAVDYIWDIEATGGGDLPEAVSDGLDVAINNMNWNNMVGSQNQQVGSYPSIKKLIFLIGDAAPHGVGSTDRSFEQGCPEGHDYEENIQDARDKGIKVYTISGSGIDSAGIRVFKEIASETGGRYTHLSYARQEVEQYYENEGFAEEEVQEYAAAARKDADYDKSTNSILTNTLGAFAKSSIEAEATDMGVQYEDPGTAEGDWINVDDITGDVVVGTEENTLNNFFRMVFNKFAFWR